MPTVFETLTDGFYTAFFESDPEKRVKELEEQVSQLRRKSEAKGKGEP